jgi:hypothetical protein
VLDEFLVHWSSLETLDIVYREIFNHAVANIDLRITQRHTGIEEIFTLLHEPEKYNRLRKLRNGISHGYMTLSDCISTATEHIELVRKAVLSMIMRIVGVNDDIQAIVLGQTGYKGKVVPHFRIVAKGSFEPGDPCRYDTHPEVEVKCSNLEVTKNDNMLVFYPTWLFTNRNCPLTYTGYEFWGDEGAKYTFYEDQTQFEVVNQPSP